MRGEGREAGDVAASPRIMAKDSEEENVDDPDWRTFVNVTRGGRGG